MRAGTQFSAVNSQILSSNLTGEPLCPGDIATFTCETRGSYILVWSSDEYIGSSGTQLEFLTIDIVGRVLVSPINPNTFATLISNTIEDGVRVLVSTLRIRALSQFLNSSVTCTSLNTATTKSVQVLGNM